ncbi:MAG: diguanylate cyclase [Pseudomonadota bacterium]
MVSASEGRFPPQLRLLLIFLGGFVLLCLVAWKVVTDAARLQETGFRLYRLNAEARTLETLFSDLRDAEIGQRGYLLTGRKEYLKPYQNALHRIGGHTDQLRGMLKDDEHYLTDLAEVEKLIQQKLLGMGDMIAMFMRGEKDEAIDLMSSSRDMGLMQEIEVFINHIVQEKDYEIQTQLEDIKTRRQQSLFWISLFVAILLMGGILSYWNALLKLRERQSLSARLEHEARHDVLTTLPNRRYFEELLEMELAQSRREEGRGMALLFIDLDGFKGVNDEFGHEAGDAALVEIGRRFRKTVRASDVLARIGGDEFAVVLANTISREEIRVFAERLIQVLGPPVLPVLRGGEVGASIGIACYPSDGTTKDELMREADSRMYQAKTEGKNSYRFSERMMA